MKEEKKITRNISIENARLVFRNFQGKGTQYNAEGNRNFGVIIEDELAEELEEEGWNVKYLKPQEDDPEQHSQPWLPVKVRFGQYPPIAVLINSRGKIKLNEDTIEQLDWTRIKYCDLIIRPYNYPASAVADAGVAAYLKAIYVTVQDDIFEEKYGDIPYLDEEE